MTKIIYRHGNALEGPEFYIAHGCNNRGVMGSGIAKAIREKYEMAYDYYCWNHHRTGLQLGEVIGIDCEMKYIFNCITQDGYGRDGKQYVDYDAIKSCIKAMSYEISHDKYQSQSVAMPKIGAGLGGGDWEIISKIIEEHATFQPVVYEL